MTMYNLIKDFPNNLIQGIMIAETEIYHKPLQRINNVVIVGMGGSGIGGLLVSQWLSDSLTVPVTLVHDYELPAFVNEHSLVIGSSYSGNTEETLLALEEARKRSCFILGVCSGGKLKEFCQANYYDCTIVPGGNPPRTALAFSIIQLMNMLSQLGLTDVNWKNPIRDAKELMENDLKLIQEEGKKLADFMLGTTPIFYATSRYEGVAIRARQQVNENAKILGWTSIIPEMNHNELVGWAGGSNQFSAIILDSGDWGERNDLRKEFTLNIIRKKSDKVYIVKTKGKNIIEKSLYLIHIVDWASLFLADALAVDSVEVNVISGLKDKLSSL